VFSVGQCFVTSSYQKLLWKLQYQLTIQEELLPKTTETQTKAKLH